MLVSGVATRCRHALKSPMEHGVWKRDGRRTGISPSMSTTVDEQQSTSQRAGGELLQILQPIRLVRPQAQREEQSTCVSSQESAPTDTSGDSCNEVSVEILTLKNHRTAHKRKHH